MQDGEGEDVIRRLKCMLSSTKAVLPGRFALSAGPLCDAGEDLIQEPGLWLLKSLRQVPWVKSLALLDGKYGIEPEVLQGITQLEEMYVRYVYVILGR